MSRLLAIAFIPNPENKPDVDHIDKNPLNNNVENLQWLSTSRNIQKSYDQGRVISEKHRLAVGKAAKETHQIISTWINEKLGLEFVGNSCELKKAFSDQKLHTVRLSKVRLGKQKHHKGWSIKKPANSPIQLL
jgi:hypothetical protein